MKALVLRKESFNVEEVKNLTLDKDEVLVKIKFAALNHRDQWIREGQYAKIQLPAILGSDGCGEVIEVQNEQDQHWIGKSVILNPNINWGTDTHFQNKEYQILGMPSQGTLAQFVVTKANRLCLKPEYLSEQQAAAIPLAGLTAFNALFNKGKAETGMNVLVSGVGGGVAQFAFLFAVAIGANVFVTSSKNEVIDKCKNLGAKGGANYTEQDAIKQLAKTIGGFDVIIDSACGDGMNLLIATLKPGGKFVFYGATRGLPKELNMRQIFWNHLQILGSTMGSDNDFKNMIQFCEQHQIQPIIDKVFELKQAVAAFDRMKEGAQFGKIIVSI